MGVDFYRAGRGIGHQIMCEEGYAWPGTMMVASDSHSRAAPGGRFRQWPRSSCTVGSNRGSPARTSS
jgi:hypothetical protein